MLLVVQARRKKYHPIRYKISQVARLYLPGDGLLNVSQPHIIQNLSKVIVIAIETSI